MTTDRKIDMAEPEAPLCPICGAASPRHCEMREETGGECPWELMDDDDGQPAEAQEWHDYDPDC